MVAALWQPMSVLIACADAAFGSDIMCSPCTLIVFANGLRSTDFVDVPLVHAASYGLVHLHVMSHYYYASTVCVGPIARAVHGRTLSVSGLPTKITYRS